MRSVTLGLLLGVLFAWWFVTLNTIHQNRIHKLSLISDTNLIVRVEALETYNSNLVEKIDELSKEVEIIHSMVGDVIQIEGNELERIYKLEQTSLRKD